MAERVSARSKALIERAAQSIPGGVNSPVRAFQAVGTHPLFIVRGEGSRVFDADQNSFIDFVGSYGPLILGHAHPSVVEAIERAAKGGTSFGAPTEAEVRLAETLIEAVPSLEKVRLVNSGTEATMSALRLARAATGRSKILKFAGCYHGHVDSLLIKAGSGATTLGVPSSPGVPEEAARSTLVATYNDIDGVRAAFEAHGSEIAAVIVEPVAGNMGVVLPQQGFLEELRRLTTRWDALLIFDEVITGFRLGWGGAQEAYGVMPDLTCLGKIIGGGLPIGAYGGKAELMELVAPAGPVYQAGTLSGNPVSVAAGQATLDVLRRERETLYAELNRKGERLNDAVLAAGRELGVPLQGVRAGSLCTWFFAEEPVVDYESATRARADAFAVFFRGMLERGVYLAPSQFEAVFLSAAHTEADLEQAADAARESLREVARYLDSQAARRS